ERGEYEYPQDSDYREDDDFFYLTGTESKSSLLVIVARNGLPAQITLYMPARNPREEVWTGPQLGPGPEATQITGIGDVRSLEHAESDVRALLADTALARNGKFLLNGLNPTHPRCSTEVEHCNAQLIAELLSGARIAPNALDLVLG